MNGPGSWALKRISTLRLISGPGNTRGRLGPPIVSQRWRTHSSEPRLPPSHWLPGCGSGDTGVEVDMYTLCCSRQGAFLLSRRPLLAGAGQVIHGDALVLSQRAEIHHDVLHLLAFQRDSNLRREEKPQGGRAGSKRPARTASLASPPRLVSSSATPSSHPRSLPRSSEPFPGP